MAVGETTQSMPATIGGGRVRRPFEACLGAATMARKFRPGEELTAEQIGEIPIRNRRALCEKGWLEIWPAAVGAEVAEHHVVHIGFGKFDIIRGKKIASGISADGVFEMTGKKVGKGSTAKAGPEDETPPAQGEPDDGKPPVGDPPEGGLSTS